MCFDIFFSFLHIPCQTEAGQVRLTFICIKRQYVPDHRQVISPTEVLGVGGGVHIGLGVDHVGGGIRVSLTSLRDISSTSEWILAKVTRIH